MRCDPFSSNFSAPRKPFGLSLSKDRPSTAFPQKIGEIQLCLASTGRSALYSTSMSTAFKVFVTIVLAALSLLALLLTASGNWKAASGALSILAVVAFFVGIGWFHFRYPLPPLPKGSSQSLWSEVRRFKEHYPGWPSKLVAYGLPTLFALAIVPRLFALIKSIVG